MTTNLLVKCRCGNCDKVWDIADLNEAKRLHERLDYPIGHPDCIEPAGECPACGALAYEQKDDQV